jgi:hypothetical protein
MDQSHPVVRKSPNVALSPVAPPSPRPGPPQFTVSLFLRCLRFVSLFGYCYFSEP